MNLAPCFVSGKSLHYARDREDSPPWIDVRRCHGLKGHGFSRAIKKSVKSGFSR
jgi:hypothetical protein